MRQRWNMARLDGSWWKFQRSYDQLKVLNDEIGAYVETYPFALSYESEIESRDVVGRFIVTELPPSMWAVQIGEIVHNLRSALEHAVWQLVLDNGQTPVIGQTGFPVFNDEVSYLQGRGRRPPGVAMLKGVPDEARDFITSIQPYQSKARGLDPREDALCVLHELWNTDKHRLLHVVALGLLAQRFQFAIEGSLDIRELRVGSRILKDGTEVARFPAPEGGKGTVKMNLDYTGEVILDETVPPAARMEVTELIGILGNEVRDVLRVLSGFARD